MRLICESCNHGYAPTLTTCPYCNTGAHVAHQLNVESTFDVECYIDYFSVKFSTGEVFQLFDGCQLDRAELRKTMSRYTLVSFNGIGYDLPMCSGAISGYTNAELKQLSDTVIVQNVKWWELDVPRLDWVDHIDMIEVAPGQGSLKAYGGKMHSKKLQDLPYKPDCSIDWPKRVFLREYCDNDLATTTELRKTFSAQIKLREEMGAEYGLDLRSKSDAQIAEAVMRKLLPFKVQVPYYQPGTTFYYRPPTWIKFVNLDLLDRLAESPFAINPKGGVSPAFNARFIDWGDTQVRLDDHGAWVKRPKDYRSEPVTIAGKAYTMGSGGLHSTESKVNHVVDGSFVLRDHDVAGYYPHLIVRLGSYPEQIGPRFQEIYAGWRERRLVAKHAGDKKTANSLKTLNNGAFGKLGSPYSIFYAASQLIQVTVTGQLALLMLIETLELSGVPVISANTDGIVLRCPVDKEWVADEIIKWWEGVTEFETERTDYSAVYSRDVNSYVAVKTNGDVKYKGAFAPPEPGASGWPNPTGWICVEAMTQYLTKGIPITDTITACTDIRQFVYVRSVKGGASLYPTEVLSKKATKRYKIERFGSVEQYDIEAEKATQSIYLGKVVRWYYGKSSCASIRTNTGGLVSRTQGCVALMELPDELPADIDYEWYVTETKSLIADVGLSYKLNR